MPELWTEEPEMTKYNPPFLKRIWFRLYTFIWVSWRRDRAGEGKGNEGE